MKEIRNVAIVGAGTMGHSLAQVFAQGGHPVRLYSRREETRSNAMRLIASNLATAAELGILEKDAPEAVLGRIRTTDRVEEAGEDADFVIEAIVEDVEVKKNVFKALDDACPPETILASNTSYLDIFGFLKTSRPDRILITHWFAPPHIVPLVEIVPGPETAPEIVETVKTLLLGLGKKPMVLKTFLSGFIANRLQTVLRNEVLFLLDSGYATAEQIDEATKASFGLRLPILGLVKRMDYTGLDLQQKFLANRSTDPSAKASSETIDKLVSEGKLGVKNGAGFYDYGGRSPEEIMKERDVKLIKLREFLRELGELD